MEEVRVQDVLELISEKLENKDYRGLKSVISELYPMDVAEVFEDLETGDCVILFRLLHKDQAAEVFSYLNASQRKTIVSAIHKNLLDHILGELYFDDKIDFLEEMPSNFVSSVIAASPPEERRLINQFLSFPDNSAGSLMTIEYVGLKKSMTIRQAMDRIKEVGVDKETIYNCYVLDDTRRLEGIVSLRRLVLSDEEMLVADIMHEDVVLSEAHDDQEDVAELFKKYDLIAVPVVDGERRLIGIITIDDIVDVIERETTEDFQKMAAMIPSDADEKYLDTSVFRLARRRIVWLMVLMISATFTGAIITHYEGMLSTAVMLAAFIPMLMNSGGNAGSQSSTLIIRGMALSEIEPQDWMVILWKELRVGLVAGFALAAVNFLRMILFSRADVMMSLTVSATLILTVTIAKLIGSILPLAAKAVKLDPAIMASPMLSTIVDACTLVIYFNIASILVL